ncbi:ATP-binding protein, partial [Adlercreutzia sp. DFI.6.23]|uniref:ATP-binding protein n=1 Tax=Adlercreutzia sp. DFI.6.23 TaxID=2963705 RepID=UPI0021093214
MTRCCAREPIRPRAPRSTCCASSPEGGHILFRVDGSAKRHGELQHLRIIVRDDGIGMSKDYLATIFDSFTREARSLNLVGEARLLAG